MIKVDCTRDDCAIEPLSLREGKMKNPPLWMQMFVCTRCNRTWMQETQEGRDTVVSEQYLRPDEIEWWREFTRRIRNRKPGEHLVTPDYPRRPPE